MAQYAPFGEPTSGFGHPVNLPSNFFDLPPPEVALAKWDGLITADAKAKPVSTSVVATRYRHDAELLLAMLGVDRTKWRALQFGDPIDSVDRAVVIGDYGSYAAVNPEWFINLRRMAAQVVYL